MGCIPDHVLSGSCFCDLGGILWQDNIFLSIYRNKVKKYKITKYVKFSIPVSCYLQHRGERRGLGGIFFDDLNEYDQELLLGFSTGNSEHKYALFFILQFHGHVRIRVDSLINFCS